MAVYTISNVTVTVSALKCTHSCTDIVSLEYVKVKMKVFNERFQYLKKATLQNIEENQIAIPRFVKLLATLPADKTNEDLLYLSDVLDDVDQADNYSEVFGAMRFHWKYFLWHHLLDFVIQQLDLNNVKKEMKVFQDSLHKFYTQLPLLLFCEVEEKKRVRPPEFSELVVDFLWSDNILFEMLEDYQLQYVNFYDLHQYIMVLAFAQHHEHFTVTWFIPDLVVKTLKATTPNEVFKKFSVISVTIEGDCVYQNKIKLVIRFSQLYFIITLYLLRVGRPAISY